MTLIATPRLLLRAPLPSDKEAIVRGLSNLEVSRWTRRIPFPYSAADAEEWLALPFDGDGLLKRAIALDGDLIGVIGIENGEIGYWIAEPHWGRGYATEAARAMTDHAFGTMGMDMLVASYQLGNAASRRILLGLGFLETGTAPSSCRATASEVTVMLLELSRARWVLAREQRT